jgi:hypothetical protein
MNTRQIVYKFNRLNDELKELKKAIEVIEDEIGRGSSTYSLLKSAHDEKLRECNIFGNIEWEEKEEKGVTK